MHEAQLEGRFEDFTSIPHDRFAALGHRCVGIPVGFMHIRGTLFYHDETERWGEGGVKMVERLATNGVWQPPYGRAVCWYRCVPRAGTSRRFPLKLHCPQQYKGLA